MHEVHDWPLATSGISSEFDGSLSFFISLLQGICFWHQRDSASVIHMKLVKIACFRPFHLVSPSMVLYYYVLELFTLTGLVLSGKLVVSHLKRNLLINVWLQDSTDPFS